MNLIKYHFDIVPGGGLYNRRVDMAVFTALAIVSSGLVLLVDRVILDVSFGWITWSNAFEIIGAGIIVPVGAMIVGLRSPKFRSASVRSILLGALILPLPVAIIGGSFVLPHYFRTQQMGGGWAFPIFGFGCFGLYISLWMLLRAQLRSIVANRLKRHSQPRKSKINSKPRTLV